MPMTARCKNCGFVPLNAEHTLILDISKQRHDKHTYCAVVIFHFGIRNAIAAFRLIKCRTPDHRPQNRPRRIEEQGRAREQNRAGNI